MCRCKQNVSRCLNLGKYSSPVWSLPTAPKQKAACPLFWNPLPKAAVILGNVLSITSLKTTRGEGEKMSAWFISSPRVHSLDASTKKLHLPSQAGIAKGLYPDIINPLRGQTEWYWLIVLTLLWLVCEPHWQSSLLRPSRVTELSVFTRDCETETDNANLTLPHRDRDPWP